jgi:hypothetical protein
VLVAAAVVDLVQEAKLVELLAATPLLELLY